MHKFALMSALFCVAAASALMSADKPDAQPQSATQAFGEKALAIFAAPTKIEAFRIHPALQANLTSKTCAGYVVTGEEKALDKDFAARIGAELGNDKTYNFQDLAGCFEPGVAYRIYKDKEFVDVAVCFDCENLIVVTDDKPSPRVTFAAYNQMLQLAKEAFPNDATVQNIKEKPADK